MFKKLSIFLAGFMVINNSNCSDKKIETRTPSYAGSFYPADVHQLTRMLDYFFSQVKIDIDSKPIGLIVPHAGYVYSGQTAAYGYSALINKDIKRVIVLATSHRAFIRGAVINEMNYKTPLGVYQIDEQAIDKLKKYNDVYTKNEIASYKEHSDEVQIPFLQKVLPKAKLVPIIVGDVDSNIATRIAESLLEILDDNTVIIVSSDFTHYGVSFDYVPKFTNKSIKEGIKSLDFGAIDYIVNLDYNGFDNYLRDTGITICGYNPIKVLIKVLELKKFNNKGKLLNYTTSGDLTGSYDHNVSYAAILFGDIKNITEKKIPKPIIDKKLINEEEEKTLLKLSRYVLTEFIKNDKKEFHIDKLKEFNITEGLQKEFGVFVTLKINDNLRGCIGYIVGNKPLYRAVIENTMNAAAYDPRFEKVRPEELDDIDIEISVMTPLEKVNSLDEIKIGRDGLYIVKGNYSGLFLPQVPLEWNWDLQTYLEELCLKAGLNPNDYKSKDAVIYKFSAQVFGEKE